MQIDELRIIFTRDLQKLATEIESFNEESAIWKIDKSIANSAGNLCLHLVGNLKTYIGATIGGASYIRSRDLEFSAKNVPRQELLNSVNETIEVVKTALEKVSDNDLRNDFPVKVFAEKTTTIGYMLIHLATHLSYHLGQVNYHRRLLDN